jgi:hypothetical protein
MAPLVWAHGILRGLAVAAAVLHACLCVPAALLLFFVGTFSWENQTPEEAAGNDWLVGAALLVALFGILLGAAVLARRVNVAVFALLAQLVVGAGVVTWAVRVSHHSDGKLLLFALAAGASAAIATSATLREQHG